MNNHQHLPPEGEQLFMLTLPKMGTRWCSHMENMSMSLTITISSWSSSKMASFSTSAGETEYSWEERGKESPKYPKQVCFATRGYLWFFFNNVPWRWTDGNNPGHQVHLHRWSATFLSQIWCPSGKHRGLIIALPPYAPSCCCFIAIFSRRGFNKPLYLFVTT